MKKIVVLGNSIAAIRALEEIRVADQESEITVFSYEAHFAYRRHLLADLLEKDAPQEKVFYKPNDFYKDKKINVIFDKKIGRVDFKKSRVITEEKEQFPYDVLIIADGADKFPEIKGVSKAGVFSLKRLSGIKDILTIIPVIDTVVVEGNSIAALKVAAGLRKRGKEVLLVIPNEYLLSSLIDRDPSEILAKHLEESGVRIVKENSISEILGDNDVKAVRLKSGKVLAAQAVMFDEVSPDLKLFTDSVLEIDQRIPVDTGLRTNLENVFALDRMVKDAGLDGWDDCEISLLSLAEQGRVAGCIIGGQEASFSVPSRLFEVDLLGLDLTFAGRAKRHADTKEWSRFDSQAKSYVKILVKDHCPLGAVLINAGILKDKVIRLVREQSPDIASLRDCLFEDSVDKCETEIPAKLPEVTDNLQALAENREGVS
ncbi:MAG TPA: FAD-dependent oxidoreductase [Candidatus Omnitrophota bacterium]|nr:FAD-dependent oxidoreductase [Candidatus Omnitrophota bacterium]HPD85028.1 FAD-dependent oxidoreductase [Candidatus Omnitrophota bacterium]HRZ03886.1 FAD-dependent oxidoreductase [Candidatus Omnitrophota bacterium]